MRHDLADRPIGMCSVSTDSNEPIAERLVDCEPCLAENAYLLIDNCNCTARGRRPTSLWRQAATSTEC